jgi:hypothetical protein
MFPNPRTAPRLIMRDRRYGARFAPAVEEVAMYGDTFAVFGGGPARGDEAHVADYRLRALDCLQRAADASDRYQRQTLLGLADAFNRLAEHVQQRAQHSA